MSFLGLLQVPEQYLNDKQANKEGQTDRRIDTADEQTRQSVDSSLPQPPLLVPVPVPVLLHGAGAARDGEATLLDCIPTDDEKKDAPK